MERQRSGQKEFREKTLQELRRKSGGYIFCQICPVNKCGVDRNGNDIRLEAHHAEPHYKVGHNTEGVMICSEVHQRKIHNCFGALTSLGRALLRATKLNPNSATYNIGATCPHKDED